MLLVARLRNPSKVKNKALESDLGSSPNSVVYLVCELGQVVCDLCTSKVLSDIKCYKNLDQEW